MSRTIKKSLMTGLFLAAATLSACGKPPSEFKDEGVSVSEVKNTVVSDSDFSIEEKIVIDKHNSLYRIYDKSNNCTIYMASETESISLETVCQKNNIDN